MKKLFLTLISLCLMASVWAYDFTSGGIAYTITSATSPYTVDVSSSSSKYTGSISIPTLVVNNSITYVVTSIGSGAFYGCTDLTSVTIPSSVTSIGADAFSYCAGLTSVTIPSSVTSIGAYAFSSCTGLTSVTIPSSVTSIGASAFHHCTGLTSVTIPSSVTSIGSDAFYGCNTIIVDAGNISYSSLDGVLFNKTQTALIQCPSSKTGNYTIPSSVNLIESYAFFYCTALTSITIPTSVTSISDYAFNACTSLTSVTIPSSVTSIGDGVFRGCSGLTSVTIPSSVTSIGGDAFSSCNALTSIYAKAAVPISLSANPFPRVNANCVLHVPAGSKTAYSDALYWKNITTIAEDILAATSNTTVSNLKINTSNGKAEISGLPEGASVAVYNLQGAVIYNQIATEETISVNLPTRGMYIVKVGSESLKVRN